MADLKGSKTEANLLSAFMGESQARNKYTYYAGKAKKDGYEQISDFFLQTADNEKEHAKIWLKLLLEGNEIPKTAANLRNSANGEHDEWSGMYFKFASEAKEEGFGQIACLFEQVGQIEKEHEERYLKLLSNVESGDVFCGDDDSLWQCRNCGHIHKGKNAPEVCPVCAHPKAYFQHSPRNF